MHEEKNEKKGLEERDPELVEDEVDDLGDDQDVSLPEYNGKPFELSEDDEYVEAEDGD